MEQIMSKQGSDYRYPFRLQQIGFNILDISEVIVASKVPQHDMMMMFREKLG